MDLPFEHRSGVSLPLSPTCVPFQIASIGGTTIGISKDSKCASVDMLPRDVGLGSDVLTKMAAVSMFGG